MSKNVERLLQAATELIWPRKRFCVCCGMAVRNSDLCPDCTQELADVRLLGDCCLRCGLPREMCACGDALPAWDSVRAAYAYQGAGKKLVHQLKFSALEAAADVLAAGMLSRLPPGVPPSLITWVPMPRKRRVARGIDHGRMLAEKLAAAWGIPALPLLSRTSQTDVAQHTLSQKQRHAHAQCAFMPNASAPPLTGKAILLVDDVMTTGATMEACARVIRRMGAAHVQVLTACRTLPGR